MSDEQIKIVVQDSWVGYRYLHGLPSTVRADLMYTIADEIEALGEELIQTAHSETALTIPRLQGEKARTINQWRLYADSIRTGLYDEIRIDETDGVQKQDIRKYNKGIGPVAVFGASNFPFAFSTAGGDTASAIAAGCSVVFKEHPAHPRTSQLMRDAIGRGLNKFGAPAPVFGYVTGAAHTVGERLVLHAAIKAVAFTGSFRGGKALFDLGSRREQPIPVFAEMGSLNPVIALPNYLENNADAFANQYLASLTLGVGQFCTNPGLVLVLKGPSCERLKTLLGEGIKNTVGGTMLHAGIADTYRQAQTMLAEQTDVELVAGLAVTDADLAAPAIFKTSASTFLTNRHLSEEIFGPTGLLVECMDPEEMIQVLDYLGGQLTITFAATSEDIRHNEILFELAQEKCGRLLFNGMPTGVEVVYGMQHGGPFPATTDNRFTAVGPDAIKRFIRPISFQNWPDEFLPAELQTANPLKMERIVNNKRIPG